MMNENSIIHRALFAYHDWEDRGVSWEWKPEAVYGMRNALSALVAELADLALDGKYGIPFDADEDRAVVSAWLQERSDELRSGEEA